MSARLRVVAAAVVVCAVSDAVLILAGVLGVGAVVERFPLALVVIRFVGAAFLLTYGVLAARRALWPSGDAIRVGAADDGVPAASEPGSAVIAPAGGHRAPAHAGATVVAGRDAAVDATTRAAGAAGRTRTEPPGRADGADATDGTNRAEGADRAGQTGRAAPTLRAATLTMLVFTWANPHVYLDTLVFLGSVANQQGVDERWWWTVGAVAASCLWFGALGFGGRLLRPLFAKPITWRVFDAVVALVMLAFGVALLVGA